MAVQPSQQEEEALVRAFFAGTENGFFVEVGANHPTKLSQSYHLEQAGWTGVLVEPQPDLAAFLVTGRSAKVFAVACTSPDMAGKQLPLHVAGPLSSLSPGKMAPGAEAEYVIMVPTRTLDQLLKEAEATPPIDMLSIDVEGHELDVLLGLDLERWTPRLIMLEDHVSDLQKPKFLRESGYRLIRHVGNNGWYVPKDAEIDASHIDRWSVIRKYYLAMPFRKVRNASRAVRRGFKDWMRTR